MNPEADLTYLQRQIYEVPEEIREALEARNLVGLYHARPPYQQNDYVGWISRAKRPETRQKRLEQMLSELEAGGVYMHMVWNG
jgi:uncharacterized protein YdeI (YjbR/CyaY-like superfamily)